MRIRRRPIAVIYDLDGVLLDTEPFYTQVTQEIVGRFGKTFDWSVKSQMIGRPSLEAARHLVAALELPITPEQYLGERTRRLEELFKASPAMRGAESFTRALAERRVPQAVATSSERRLFELKTLAHSHWFAVFHSIVTGDDPRVLAGKPAPDIFLRAAADLGVAAVDCLVFEDAPVGVTAARSAGMQVIALPDPAMDREPYREADLVVASFDELTPIDLGIF